MSAPAARDGAPLAVLGASPARRAAGAAMFALLGAILLWVAGIGTPAPLWAAFLVVAGTGALAGAVAFWRTTGATLVLTREALGERGGREIARVADMRAVERGALAFKPARGFLLHLQRPAPWRWAPGLWWRLGRRVGVGGVTGAAETRAMAEIIAVLIAERAEPSDLEPPDDGGPPQKHS